MSDEELQNVHEALQDVRAQLANLEGAPFTRTPFSAGPHCSFCGKNQDECKLLVQGPSNVHICNQCICASKAIVDSTLG